MNPFDQFDEQQQANPFDRFDEEPSLTKAVPAALARGTFAGIPSIPVEAALNVADLGIAGYGAIKGAFGSTDLPSLLDRSKFAGSHDWLVKHMPEWAQYRLPEGASTGSKMLESALELAPAGAIAPNKILGASLAGAGGGLARLAQENDLPPSAQLLAQVAPAVVAAGAARTPLARPSPTETGVADMVANKIYPLPGQLIGPAAQRLESKATSLPVVGDVVVHAQDAVKSSFNRALYRRALANIGPEAAKEADSMPVGRDGVARVGNKLSDAYETALNNSQSNLVDPQFNQSIARLRTMVDDQATFDKVMQRAVFDRSVVANPPVSTGGIVPAGVGAPGPSRTQMQQRYLTPSEAKSAESELGQAIRDRMGSADERTREVSRALRQAQEELRTMVARNNPDQAPIIQAINKGWADLVQIENAAARAGSKDGVITPSQYRAAVKQGDSSVRDRKFARGDALNQTFAENAERIIGNTYPDSGTVGRYFTLSPKAWMVGGLGAIPAAAAYSGPGRWLMSHGARPASLLRSLRENEPYLTMPLTAGLAQFGE